MSLIRALEISASGLSAQRARLEVTTSNIANIHTTRTPGGGPYSRKDVVFKSAPPANFEETLRDVSGEGDRISCVRVDKVVETGGPFPKRYQPDHPDADSDGYVTYPNVDLIEEMANLLSATRSYEANVTVVEAIKIMGQRTMDILK